MTYSRSRARKGAAPAYCAKHAKRKYRSRNVALRAGEAKYGVRSDAYKCPQCGSWHLTRRGTRLDENQAEHYEAEDVADALVAALGIGDEA